MPNDRRGGAAKLLLLGLVALGAIVLALRHFGPSATAALRVRGASADSAAPMPPLPALPDSLGLMPGERMALPDGRIVTYDSTTIRVQR